MIINLIMLCCYDVYVAQVCKSLRFSGVSVPRDYEQGFQRALWTFQHQRVWCPHRKQLVHLRPLPQGGLAAGNNNDNNNNNNNNNDAFQVMMS